VTDLRELQTALAEALVAQATARERLAAAPDDANAQENAQEEVRRAESHLQAAVRRALPGP